MRADSMLLSHVTQKLLSTVRVSLLATLNEMFQYTYNFPLAAHTKGVCCLTASISIL